MTVKLSAHLVREDTLDLAHLMNQRIKAYALRQRSTPSKGSASELRHFLGAEEGIKASCMLTSAASYTPDLVYTCLPRSRDTLGSCSTSFNGRVQQGVLVGLIITA